MVLSWHVIFSRPVHVRHESLGVSQHVYAHNSWWCYVLWVSLSMSSCLSAWFPDTCVKNRLEREWALWADVLSWVPRGFQTLNIPLLSTQMSAAPVTHSCFHFYSPAVCLFLFLFLSLPFHSSLSVPSISLSLNLSLCIRRLSLFVPVLYSRVLPQTKDSHVGRMHVRQIWCWLCGSWDELLEQLHSSLIRWHTDSNENHNSLFVTSCTTLLKQKKNPALCNMSKSSCIPNTQRKWAVQFYAQAVIEICL